jgi:uroporphyrinogen decarboxylase
MSLWKHWIDENTFEDVWGARRRMITNEYGSHTCLVDYPLAQADSIDDLKQYPWPDSSWWDFSSLPDVIKTINLQQEYHLRYRMGSIFETAWSLCGLDTILLNFALKPQLVEYMMDRILEVHTANLIQVMELSQDQIDMVYLYDDLAQQNGLLMSEQMWKQIIAPRQKKLFDLAHSYGKSVMMHICGDIGPLVKGLSEIGVDLLNPIQTSAMKMDYPEIKSKFGDWIAFHGGIDIQQFLPNATPQEVQEQVQRAKELLGHSGGYILTPTHHIQADTPLENILAIYGK